MLDSFQALLVTFVALLPGALYVWSFERQAGRYGVGLSDRLLRFLGGSALFLTVFTVPLYVLWTEYWEPLSQGEPVPLWLGLAPLAYALMPVAGGTVVGTGLRRGWRWVTAFTGPHPAPRAWDYLFQYRVDGWVRLSTEVGAMARWCVRKRQRTALVCRRLSGSPGLVLGCHGRRRRRERRVPFRQRWAAAARSGSAAVALGGGGVP